MICPMWNEGSGTGSRAPQADQRLLVGGVAEPALRAAHLDGVVTCRLNLLIVQYLKKVSNPRVARGQFRFRALPSHLLVRESCGGNQSPGGARTPRGVTKGPQAGH